jgi:enoyl-CoA hydratase/carnithine racemase
MEELLMAAIEFEVLGAATGQVGRATLNVEATLNSLTLDMVDLLQAQLDNWAQDDSIAAVFVDAAGEKAFCAGGDVQALHASAVATPGGPCEYAEDFFTREYRMNYSLHTYPKPLICWGHGIVMGGGLGVMAGCSHRIVTERTRIAMPEVTIALFPDVGGSWFLNHAPGSSGEFLALTGASINAADAIYIGLADRFIASEHKDAVLKQRTGPPQARTITPWCAMCYAPSRNRVSAPPLPARWNRISRPSMHFVTATAFTTLSTVSAPRTPTTRGCKKPGTAWPTAPSWLHCG